MRFITRILLLVSLAATFAHSQTTPPPFQHVVIVVQENRTPDNLFGAGAGVHATCGSPDSFETGVDIDNGGPMKGAGVTCLTADTLSDTSPGHKHTDWDTQCDLQSGGLCAMDGAPLISYRYVTKGLDQPYFDIATNYGFANYMFQTNEGPSFPAHQLIFGGTSAPVWPGTPNNPNPYYQYFVAENATDGLSASGCPATGSSGWPEWVDPDDSEGGDQNSSECYDRNTLVTYQDSSGNVHDWTATWSPPFSTQPAWKYYMPTKSNADKTAVIWNAPQDDPQICYFASTGGGTACISTEYSSHVDIAQNANMLSAPILSDIQRCQLPAISWVIPDERWSDHPDQNGLTDSGTGPDWVAAIVDSIGQSYSNSGGQCDYWGYPVHPGTTPQPTVIFIIWDDWGGFYDHVPPPKVYRGDENDNCTAEKAPPNGWGCGYVYGFRVPLLVVSEYTPVAYVSGAIPSPGAQGLQHDFGSILRFIEKNFTLQGYNLPTIAPTGFTYADQNTLDAVYNGNSAVPLWDFFQATSPRLFTPISPINPEHTASFFESYYQTEQQGVLPTPYGPEYGDED